jgi:hypothetical protein
VIAAAVAESIAELCRKGVLTRALYYCWSKEFVEAGKKRLAAYTTRAATDHELKGSPATEGTASCEVLLEEPVPEKA